MVVTIFWVLKFTLEVLGPCDELGQLICLLWDSFYLGCGNDGKWMGRFIIMKLWKRWCINLCANSKLLANQSNYVKVMASFWVFKLFIRRWSPWWVVIECVFSWRNHCPTCVVGLWTLLENNRKQRTMESSLNYEEKKKEK